jgi:hypothetical protein
VNERRKVTSQREGGEKEGKSIRTNGEDLENAKENENSKKSKVERQGGGGLERESLLLSLSLPSRLCWKV